LFGYITPYKQELKVREYDLFKGYYCGLCKTLGKEFNQATRFGLNYDLTFLAILLSSLDEDRDTIKSEVCIANPFRKKPVIQTNKHIKYTACISSMLIYFKLLDDWKDEKSLLALVAMIGYILPLRKSKRLYKDKYESIKKQLAKLNELEKNKCDRIDESADAFAKLMEDIAISPFITDENTTRILKWIGYNMGRWIYILDGFNDIERDIKNKNYNPILLQYKYTDKEEINDFIDRIKEPIEFTLTYTLDNIGKSFELLNIKYNRGILDNIVYMGTRFKMEQIISKKELNRYEESI